ncbi:MAG: hypothetical protein ACFE8J_10880 [Candidatus Heimdallarchaeota archaeon]
MSIHGNQYILPFFSSYQNVPSIKDNDELALAFYLLTRDIKESENILSFSRLLWPFLSVQGVIGTHIILDGLKVFSRKGKFTNPPRQPLIGHLLRNIENRTKIEELNKIIEVLTYKDTEAKEIGEEEDTEFQALEIEALINPEFLQTLIKLIPLIEYSPISEYMPLDTGLSTEGALNIADKYRKMIEYMRGNARRWESQIGLIEKEVEKWLIELNVQLKDIDSRYSSQITKTSQIIDTDQIKEQVAIESDKIDQWRVAEKKKVIESISVLFKTAERQLEEMIKKNKFFTRTEMLKGRIFNDLTGSFEEHFKYLLDEGQNFIDSLNLLTKKYVELKERAAQVEDEAKKKLEKFTNELQVKLKDRDKHLSEFKSEKEEMIQQISDLKSQIEKLFMDIKNVVQTKHANCLRDAQDLTNWSLNDNQAELFSRPVQWIYMPLYAIFVEDKNIMEEKFNILLPGYITNDPNNIYKEISEEMVRLKNILNERLEEDMALRSNFEFSCENKNLIKDKNLIKKIQQGVSILRNYSVTNTEIEAKIREKTNSLF